jgi:hypothetical protein
MNVVGYSKLLIDEQMRTEPQRGYGSVEQFSQHLRRHLLHAGRRLSGAE